MSYIPFDVLEAETLAEMTPDERVEYELECEKAERVMQLAELVYDTRKNAGYTQTELARRMGTSQTVISQLETGMRTPTIAMLDRLARATGQQLTCTLTSLTAVESAA
jgi:ribosome-binding protein aMBF1 (putative translation factor)